MSEPSPQPTLEWAQLSGERVRLRPVQSSDAALLFPLIYRRRAILEWLIWDGPTDLAELAEGYAQWCKPSAIGDDYHFTIVDLADEAPVGTIGARFQGHPFVADLGYWLSEERWGRGLMSEAIALLAHLCFGYLEARALNAEVFVGNEASARVLSKNGFVADERAYSRLLPDDSFRQARLFTLTARRFARLGISEARATEVRLLPDRARGLTP